jgi:hypothetical protein
MTDLVSYQLGRLGLIDADGKIKVSELHRLGLLAGDGSIKVDQLNRMVLGDFQAPLRFNQCTRMVLVSGLVPATLDVQTYQVVRMVLMPFEPVLLTASAALVGNLTLSGDVRQAIPAACNMVATCTMTCSASIAIQNIHADLFANCFFSPTATLVPIPVTSTVDAALTASLTLTANARLFTIANPPIAVGSGIVRIPSQVRNQIPNHAAIHSQYVLAASASLSSIATIAADATIV